MSEITKKKQSRNGHRTYARKVLAKVKSLVENVQPEAAVELTQLKLSLKGKLETIMKLDETILDMLEKSEDIEQEIESSSEFVSDIHGGIAAIDNALKKIEEKKLAVPKENAENTPVSSPNSIYNTRVKLPKLEVRKFSGKIQDWQEFWEPLKALYIKMKLNNIDKFTYLQGLVEEPAKSAIAGFALTAINYVAAVEVLQR